jgi:mRNA interferase RelE/StbE
MAWKVEISKFAQKDLRNLDKSVVSKILKYLSKNIDGCKNPRDFGKPLSGDLVGLYRFRVESYRLINMFIRKRSLNYCSYCYCT